VKQLASQPSFYYWGEAVMKCLGFIKAIAVAIAIASAAPASAAVITFEGHLLSRNVNIFHEVLPNRSETAGQMSLTIDGSPFIGYCVDLDNDAPNTWDATLEPVTSIDNGVMIAWLFDTFAAGVTTNNEAAGLQVAIWEVLDDGDTALNLSAGDFRLNVPASPAAVQTQAQIYLNAIPADLSGYLPQSIIVFSSEVDQAQHMIVPEPSSIAGLILGAAIALRRSRR